MERETYQVIVSSLAIHHLDGLEKQELFQDLIEIVEVGGTLIIADISLPAGELALKAAAEMWE